MLQVKQSPSKLDSWIRLTSMSLREDLRSGYMQNRRPTQHSAVDLLPVPTIGYARMFLRANLQTTGFAAQLRLKWVAGPRFSPPHSSDSSPMPYTTTTTKSSRVFQVQVYVRNLGVNLRFCM